MMNGVSKYGIMSIAVFTAENPDTQPASKRYNRKANKSLSKCLKDGRYIFVPAKGKFGDNNENSFAVFNIPLYTVKHLAGKYQQSSFIYSTLQDGKVHSEYWEKENKDKPYDSVRNEYVVKDTSDSVNDMSNADDCFTIIGNKFKYSIPFPTLMEVNEYINESVSKWVAIQRQKGFHETEESVLKESCTWIGFNGFRIRSILNSAFFKD